LRGIVADEARDSLFEGNHRIWDRLRGDAVEVIVIFHGARDV
jgi:plasmid stabilization system protein ParE